MNYSLSSEISKKSLTARQTVTKLWPLLADEKRILFLALGFVIATSLLNLIAPLLIAYAIDTYILQKDYHGVLVYGGIILSLYLMALITSYFQTRLMGEVGQRVLYRLRNQIFEKLQSLPVAFFNQNKTGDLISRINNDTDKISEFFSRSVVQFFSSIFLMMGSAIFLLSLNFKLGVATLTPALVLFVITKVLSSWIQKRNLASAKALGELSSEVQESIDNFKVIIAFNRRDFFRQRFSDANEQKYKAAVSAGIANISLTPVYGLASNFGQLIVLAYGISLISTHAFTIGLLISFLSYSNSFYNPLRQIAALFTSLQTALASWDRVSEILLLENDLPTSKDTANRITETVIEFKGVNFRYPDGKEVLHNVNLNLKKGKTYALVGPTGGGKTTTASLMSRLYDPTNGQVMLSGKDIKTYSAKERSQKIGFILQEPILFSGTVFDNILYANAEYKKFTVDELETVIKDSGLQELINRFDKGLLTEILVGGEDISLGQKQLIAFIRAVLRKPEVLILDEATANIDTVTEQILENILAKLPRETTKIIIAHRLNTIENADEIFFVNSGNVIKAGSMKRAVEMLLHGNIKS